MALNQITKIRLPDGREVAFVDWTDRPLFSTIEVLHGAAVQRMDFFQYVVGDNVPAYAPVAITAQRTANELDTNLATPGSLASTEEFMVYAIKPEVFRRQVADEANPDFAAPAALVNESNEPAATPLMYSILNHRTTLNLEISQKVYASAGFGYFNSGFGPVGESSIDATPGRGDPIGNNGLQTQEAVRSYVIPMHIGGQEKFRVFLKYVDDGTGNGLEIGQEMPQSVEAARTPDLQRFARIRVYLDGLYKRPTS